MIISRRDIWQLLASGISTSEVLWSLSHGLSNSIHTITNQRIHQSAYISHVIQLYCHIPYYCYHTWPHTLYCHTNKLSPITYTWTYNTCEERFIHREIIQVYLTFSFEPSSSTSSKILLLILDVSCCSPVGLEITSVPVSSVGITCFPKTLQLENINKIIINMLHWPVKKITKNITLRHIDKNHEARFYKVLIALIANNVYHQPRNTKQLDRSFLYIYLLMTGLR